MFEGLKKLLGAGAAKVPESEMPRDDTQRVAAWAKQQGYHFAAHAATPGHAAGFKLDTLLQGHPWHMECGRPSRDFILTQELRGRSELGVLGSVSVVVMNRPLKVALEKRAYALYTDSLHTSVDPKLPDEMRWLAVFPEVGWHEVPPVFFERYAVLAGKREHASTWIGEELATAMLNWPLGGPTAETPFVLMLLRGKCYIRMEYSVTDLATLQQAVRVFRSACTSALERIAPNLTPPVKP